MEAVTKRSDERIDKAVAKRGHEVALSKAVGERCRPARSESEAENEVARVMVCECRNLSYRATIEKDDYG